MSNFEVAELLIADYWLFEKNRSDHVDCKCSLLRSITIVFIQIVRQIIFEREKKLCANYKKNAFK